MALSWIFELKDQMSGPAKQIVINLNQVQSSTDKAKKGAQSASVSFGSLAKSMGLVAIASGALHLAEEFGAAVFEANRFAERTKIAFEVLTGSTYQASESFQEAKRVAIALGVPLEGVATAYRELLLGGESVDNLQVVTKAAADLAALGGGSIESWAQAFADIQSKGELAGRSLMQFKGVLDFDVLAKKLGFATHGFKALVTQLSAAPVSAHKGIEAILQSIAAKEGGAIETVSQRLANTFSGTVQSIKDELLSLFEFDSSDSPILDFLHGVRDALAPGGPLVAGIKAGASAFMEGLGVFSGPGGFDGFVKSLKDGTVLGKDFKATMRSVGEDVRAVVELTVDLGKALGTVARGLAEIRRPGSAVERIASTPGVELTAEARAAIRAMEVSKAGGSVGVGEPLEDLRFQAGESVGMNGSMRGSIPHFASGGRVTGPTLAVVGDGGEPENMIPDSKMGGFGARINLNLEQHFHVHGGGEAPVRELAGDLHALGLGDFQGALDTLASIAGAH